MGSGLIAWGLLSLGWLLLSAQSSAVRPSTWQIVSFVEMMFSLAPLGWDAARALRRNERADLTAADLTGDPMAYLAALKHLETVRLQAMKLDTSLTEPPATVTMRRKRLERRLGLEP